MATFGRMLRNGSEMVFDRLNAQGGLVGRHLEWTIYNSGCQFEMARQATQQAIADGFRFIIGPICSEAAIGAALAAESEKALLITPTATHPLVTVNEAGQTRPTIFRASYATPFQGQAAARFARDTLEANKAALLFDPLDDYASRLADAFAKQFTRQGGQVVYRATYALSEIDFTTSLQTIYDAGAQIIYLPAPASMVNQVAHQLHELGLANSSLSFDTASGLEVGLIRTRFETSPLMTSNPNSSTTLRTGLILLGSDSWQSETLDLAATAGSYFTTHFALADNRETIQVWSSAYQATYAVEPTTIAALSYDAATILTEAIQQAGTFEIATLVKVIEQSQYEGVTGQIAFDSQHNPIKPVPVMQIQDGQILFSTLIFP